MGPGMGIEPILPEPQSGVLPLDEPRHIEVYDGFEPSNEYL